MSESSTVDSSSLLSQLKNITKQIIDLKNNHFSYYEELFPNFIINYLHELKLENIDLYTCDDEYFNFLRFSQILFLEITLVKSLRIKNLNHIPDNKNVECLLYDLYNIFSNIKEYKTTKSLEKYKEIEENYNNTDHYIYIPRLIRACSKFKFNLKQIYALEFIISSQSTPIPNHFISKRFLTDYGSIGFVCDYCGFTAKESLEFFADKSIHIQQGFIELDSDYRTYLNTLLKSSLEILKACVGCKLNQKEFLKIDNTVMSDVLREEPTFSILTLITDDNTIDDIEDISEELSDSDSHQDIMQFIAEQIKETNEVIDMNSSNENDKNADDDNDDSKDFLTPYKTDIEYLTDQFELLASIMKRRIAEMDETKEKKSYMDIKKEEASLRTKIREQTGVEKMMRAKCSKRLILTKKQSKWYPRLEILSDHLKLTEFEKHVIIITIGGIVSSEIRRACSQDFLSNFSEKKFEIGVLLWVLCSTLEDQMKARSYFYKSGTLVKEGIIHLSSALPWSRGGGDLMSSTIEIDRRMLDFLAGIDSELNELVEGSNLYKPKVELNNVILPQEQKEIILKTVENFENFTLCKKSLGLQSITDYGHGIVLLFYGPSGTGKTMMANALASHLQKRLLLINFGSLQDKTGEKLRFIFREAKINDAVLFFDECEAMFESRDKIIGDQAAILTAIERHEGLIIMATNRAYDLDEAMYRRISLSIEFPSPDPGLREEIWKTHIPKNLQLEKDIDFRELSLNYELTGGFIKNAISVALSSAVARDGKNPTVSMDDLIAGAKLQLRGCMQMTGFDSKVIPNFTFSDLILPKKDIDILKSIVKIDKAQKVLFQHWGFKKQKSSSGIVALFHGPSGCGKTTAAEAIASDLGKPLLIVNIAALLSKHIQRSISFQKIFKEAKDSGAILILESCESLCGDTCSSLESSTLFYHIEHFNGIVILITRNGELLGKQFLNQFKYIIEFKIPSPSARIKLWRNSIPEQVPLADDVDFNVLGEDYAMSGGNIKDSAFTACSSAALQDPDAPVSMKAFQDAAKEELLFTRKLNAGPRFMFN